MSILIVAYPLEGVLVMIEDGSNGVVKIPILIPINLLQIQRVMDISFVSYSIKFIIDDSL